MAENKIKNMKVERETFESKGKTYFAYFIRGTVRGKDVKLQIAPPHSDTDKGGYALLDVVFGDEMEAELVVNPFEMKAEDGGTITGNTYMVRSYDEDGEVYECAVKPARPSDKTFLKMLLR